MDDWPEWAQVVVGDGPPVGRASPSGPSVGPIPRCLHGSYSN